MPKGDRNWELVFNRNITMGTHLCVWEELGTAIVVYCKTI